MMFTPAELGSTDVQAENLRLKQVIEEQQRQIDAMVVGASMAQPSLAAPAQRLATPQKSCKAVASLENPQLLALLDLAQRYRICTASQKQMMLGFVESGRFSAQYYIDMWSRRLTDHSPQATSSLHKVLSAGAPTRPSSLQPRPRVPASTVVKDVVSTPTAAFASPVVTHRAHGIRSPDVQLAAAAASRPAVVHRAPGICTPCVSPHPAHLQGTFGAAAETLAWPSLSEDAPDAEDVKMEFVQENIKMECVEENGQTEQEQEWVDAPKELMRRATRTFVQDDDSQDIDPSGEWRGRGTAHAELSSFKCDRQLGQSDTFRLPRDLFERLRPYQRAGVAWMAQLYQSRKGGILADEMGLGKTVQACALLNGIRSAGATHVLIIVPVSLLDQWDREATKWCPAWRVFTYHGSPAQRVRALQGVMAAAGGILLTSYSVLKNADDRLLQVAISNEHEEDDEFGPLNKKARGSPSKAAAGRDESQKRPWDLVICDEAHVMRNISTLLGRHLRNILARSRVLLTGTPVQNALHDLWSLMDFAQPGLLGNHTTFIKNVSDPIDKGSVRGANPFAVQLKKHLCEQLWDLVKPHMLRRTKESVGLVARMEASVPAPISGIPNHGDAPLPPKLETVIWLMPTNEQVKATQKLLEKSEVIQEANSTGKMGFAVFRAIALLKRMCNHPALGLPVSEPDAWQDFLREAFGKAKGKRKACSSGPGSVAAGNATCTNPVGDPTAQEAEGDDVSAGRAVEMMLRRLPRDVESLISQSAKLTCLSKMLPALGALGHRTLIFSQGLKMMDLVELCILKKLGITYLRIDGSTDVQTRADRIQQFQNQPGAFQCMLLTTGVGGYGLNLTGADRVIMLDPAWNPAVDAQAVERVHRIGQKREVRVYRLVMSGLIEDKMFRLQVFKMGLTKTALEAKQQQRYFTSAEIRGLFQWTDPAQGETRNVLMEKHGEAQENVAMVNAQDDHAHEGWLAPGLVVGLSNFSMLYNSVANEDLVPDDECEAQVAEMKAALGRVDENIHRTAQERQAVEEELRAAQSGVQDAAKNIAAASVARAKATAVSKNRHSELVKARRQEASAFHHLEKVMRRRVSAREAKLNADELKSNAEHGAAASGRTAAEGRGAWQDAVCAVDLAFTGAEGTVSQVQDDGHAAADGHVEVAAGKAKAAQKCLERAQKAWDAVKAGWTVLENAEGSLLQMNSAHDGRQKDQSRAEATQEKATLRAEAARDAAANAVSTLVEAGAAFAEALQVARGHDLSAAALKAEQQAAKAKIRQVYSTWTRAKQLQETWARSACLCQRTAKKHCTAAIACAEVDDWLETVEGEHQEALASEERERSLCLVSEQAMLEAEGQRTAAEVEDSGQKRRRSECQGAIVSARSKLRPAKCAEKEASVGRAALLSHYSKADKGQIKIELDAASSSVKEAISAVNALKAEQYDVNQVEDAYQAKKKPRTDAAADNID